MSLSRRALLLGTLAAGGCARRCGEAPPSPEGSGAPKRPAVEGGRWIDLDFAPTEHFAEAEHATVLVEGEGPLVVAFHGRGEVDRGLVRGSRGWRDDYRLAEARERVARPPLEEDDLLGFVTDERLQALNASLAAHPFEALAVACPWCPALSDRSPAGAEGFGRFVVDDLIPEVRRRLGGGSRETTSVDGVSMGGRLALLVGLAHPEVFGAVACQQPAIAAREADDLVALVRRARQVAPLRLRLVTSTGDYFREAVEAFSKALTAAGEEHDFLLTEGPHDYAWNRGPGSYELLLWHERVLRGIEPP